MRATAVAIDVARDARPPTADASRIVGVVEDSGVL
jgi:hypothetical protein